MDIKNILLVMRDGDACVGQLGGDDFEVLTQYPTLPGSKEIVEE